MNLQYLWGVPVITWQHQFLQLDWESFNDRNDFLFINALLTNQGSAWPLPSLLNERLLKVQW